MPRKATFLVNRDLIELTVTGTAQQLAEFRAFMTQQRIPAVSITTDKADEFRALFLSYNAETLIDWLNR